MSIQEIVQLVLDSEQGQGVARRDLFYSDFNQEFSKWDDANTAQLKTLLVDNELTVENVDSFGGEGMGDQYWSVYKFSKGDDICYVKFDGYYASYNGAEFNEWFFARSIPVQKIDWVSA
jgi:hypothetical protein